MKENKYLEYKSEVTNTFLKTVSAYANYASGVIQFGIRDDGSICGIKDPEKACLDIENRINDSISPKPDYSLRISPKHDTIELLVSEGVHKPYLYKGKAYKRNDTATIEVDQIELKRLILAGSNLYFEDLPSELEEASFKILEEKLIERLGITALTTDMLRTFGFYTRDGKLNIAGALFSDRNHFYGIDLVRFGRTINEIQERMTVSGVSVLKQYDEAVEMFRRYYQYEKIEGFERVAVELIPEEAFREAIANALVHRQWDMRSHIRISMYADRIEIASPGGLPTDVTEDEYLNGNLSYLRNPVIGNLFFRMHYIEMFGTGIRRIKESYRESARKPQFHITENSITILLPVRTQSYGLSADGQKVMDLFAFGNLLSGQEIAVKLGWKKDKTIREINKLKALGYLQVFGRGRGTKYTKA